MKKSVIGASLAGVLAALIVAAPQALAKGKPPPPPPPATPDNTAEWALIHLTSTDVSLADGGNNVVIGLFDGYTDCRHVDLTGHCEANAISGGNYRFYDSHGTHTAGIVAGAKTGVAPRAKIVNYAVFDDSTYVATGTKLITAWQASVAKGASIANMSFGCTRLAFCFTAAEVKAMGTTPLLYVKAAGNDGANLSNESIAVTKVEALAALERTLIVGSVELSKSMASYSNKPGNNCLLYGGATGCDADMKWMNYFIVAPGSSIYSTLPGNSYGMMSGTSMATPVVAGAAALIKAEWPSLSPETIADILLSNTDDLGVAGVDAVYGRGLLNVEKAFDANGTLKMFGPTGESSIVTGTTATSSPTFSMLPAALGSISVYDRWGRDYALGNTRLGVRRTYDAVHRLLGRRLLGLGSQADWSSAMFETRHAPLGFAGFGSFADPVTSAYRPDTNLRMGMDMPFKGGVAQMRMTGSSSARLDFAYDPTLRPLAFFASTALLKSSMFGQALFNLGANSRLAVYGTTNAPGSLATTGPREPLLLRNLGENSTARLAIDGQRADQRQHGFGIGYWARPDRHTVVGVNANYLIQDGGYYDMASDTPGLDGTARLFNLGAVVSRAMGSFELSAAGEVTRISMSGTSSPLIQLTDSNIVSAEIRLRKAEIAADGDRLADSLSLALVMPPRAVSGALHVDYMGPTADRMGRQPYSLRYSLSELSADPVKVEAGYQVMGATGWSLEVTGGLNLRQDSYAGRGEALASFRMAF